MKINYLPEEIPEIVRATFIHILDCLDKHFRHAPGMESFEVKSLDISKSNNTASINPLVCHFKVAHSLKNNYVISFWYMGAEAIAITTETQTSNQSIVHFLQRFPAVEEIPSIT